MRILHTSVKANFSTHDEGRLNGIRAGFPPELGPWPCHAGYPGHTRPFLRHGHEVTIAACGNALTALQREFPSCRFIEFEDYPSPYSAGRFFLPKLSVYFPVLLRAVARERRETGTDPFPQPFRSCHQRQPSRGLFAAGPFPVHHPPAPFPPAACSLAGGTLCIGAEPVPSQQIRPDHRSRQPARAPLACGKTLTAGLGYRPVTGIFCRYPDQHPKTGRARRISITLS